MRSSKAILLIASLLVAPAAAIAQTPPDPTTPTLKVYSRETIVDTTVTDKKGDPIHDLLKPDFTLKEDNKPQPIRGFHEYSTQPVPPQPKLPPNVYTNLQPPAPTSAINILLLDFTNAAPVLAITYGGMAGPKDLARAMQRQRMIKQEAMKYLQTIPTGTRVTVLGASYPGNLHILQGITSDPALLSAAIDNMEYDTDAMAASGETWCAQLDRRNRMTLESLDQIAADVAGIKGRKKVLIYLTNQT